MVLICLICDGPVQQNNFPRSLLVEDNSLLVGIGALRQLVSRANRYRHLALVIIRETSFLTLGRMRGFLSLYAPIVCESCFDTADDSFRGDLLGSLAYK